MKSMLTGFVLGALIFTGISVARADSTTQGVPTVRQGIINQVTPKDSIVGAGKLISNAVTGQTGSLYEVTDASRRTYCYTLVYAGSAVSLSCVRY